MSAATNCDLCDHRLQAAHREPCRPDISQECGRNNHSALT